MSRCSEHRLVQNLIGSNLDFHYILVYKGAGCSACTSISLFTNGENYRESGTQRARQKADHVIIVLPGRNRCVSPTHIFSVGSRNMCMSGSSFQTILGQNFIVPYAGCIVSNTICWV